jgi:hypothetical protein
MRVITSANQGDEVFYISKTWAAIGVGVAGVALTGAIGVTAAIASGSGDPVVQVSAETAAADPVRTVTVTAEPLPAVTVTADPVPAVTVTETVTATATAAPKKTTGLNGKTFGAGTWKVGSEIPAGTYVTSASKGEHCYYARLSGFSGDLDDIIANEIYSGPARGRVTIASSDLGVKFSGACEWSKE